jgi:hypothetical protein
LATFRRLPKPYELDKDGDGQVGEDPVLITSMKIDEDPHGLWDIYLADVLLP